VLNDATRRCDCAFGYRGAASRSRANRHMGCSRCSSRQSSPGGELGRAKCSACARGEVSNADRSACVAKNSWPAWSVDDTNRRWAVDEKRITPASVARFAPKWTFETDGDVSATPALAKGRLYFPW